MSRILHLLQEPPQPDEAVLSGNDLRTRQLQQALRAGGHELVDAHLRGPGMPPATGAFRNRDELQGIILRESPNVILVAYWELLTLLPFELKAPVILDFVAPRPLEELFESPATVQASLARLRSSLHVCDLVLTGNEAQAQLLIPELVETGHDLRMGLPLLTVPLGAPIAPPPASEPGPEGMTWVMGGVAWPWRREQAWLDALERASKEIKTPLKVMRFEGRYRLHDDPQQVAGADKSGVIQQSPLLPYSQYSEFLTHQAHVGIELADWNVERAFSQSFRSLDFLRHGLPLVCNRYLPLASLVEQYDAGWLLDKPEDIAEVLKELDQNSASWQRKSAAAYKMASEALSIEATTAALLEWLKSPVKSPRLASSVTQDNETPVLGVPPFRQRLKRQFGLMHQVITARLFGQEKAGKGVLFVTRSDLFPANHGAAVRTIETARALGEQGVPVGIVTDDQRTWFEYEQGEFRRRTYPFWLRFCHLPAPLVKLLHYSKDLPQSNSFLYLPLTDGGFFWRILVAGKRIHVGTLQAEFPAYAEPCLKARAALDAPVVLVEHNVEYLRLRAQIAELTEKQFENLKAIEIDLCQRADAVVCVSDADRQQLVTDGVPPTQLSTIPHGVHIEKYAAPSRAGLREELGIATDDILLAYHGTFSYPPNRQAIRIFADELLPRLEALGHRCHVLAVGRDAPAGSPHERIHFTGSVEDLAPWLKAADMAVVPLVEGGGTRMKIIDCFAARLALISTSKGIEGIPIEPGKQALVIDDWQEMAEAIIELFSSDEKRKALAAAAFAMAEELDWSEIARRYRALYSSLA